jgi:protoporphyrinogen oxidase
MRVGIVGGGLTGLALAHEFGGGRAEVAVFERGIELGGLAAGFEALPGIRLERFYDRISQSDVDIQALMADLGLGSRIMWRPANFGFYLDDSAHHLSTPLDVLRSKPLNL